MTTDLNIVGLYDKELQSIMEMGPAHRHTHAKLLPVPEQSGYDDTFQGRLKYMFYSAFRSYIKDKKRRYEDIDPFVFELWMDRVVEQVHAKVDAMSADQVRRGEAQQARAVSEMDSLAKRVAKLHEHLVFTQADKERVYTACCRHYYEGVVMCELESGGSYAFVGGGAQAIDEWRAAVRKHIEMPAHYARPQHLPDMPTRDAEARPEAVVDPPIGPHAPQPTRWMHDNQMHDNQAQAVYRSYADVMQELHGFCKANAYFTKPVDEHGKLAKRPAGESELQTFIRTHKLSYLYATIKTHKEPMGWRFIAGGTGTALEAPNKWLNCAMQGLLPDIHAIHSECTRAMEQHTAIRDFYQEPVLSSFNLSDTSGMVTRLATLRREIERHRSLANPQCRGDAELEHLEDVFKHAGRLWKRKTEMGVWDFTTLYLSLEHDLVVRNVTELFKRIFARKAQKGLKVLAVCPHKKSVEWLKKKPPKTDGGVRYYELRELSALVEYIVRHAYVAVGDAVYKQTSGIPMGFSASPMIAVFTLSWQEITGLERLARLSMEPDGQYVPMPTGDVMLSPATRPPFMRLVATLARCCRNIDDVLFVNMTRCEQQWAYVTLYQPGRTRLEMKLECCSPGRIKYLDTEIVIDRRSGLTTIHYDKRMEMQRKRGSDVRVRRFPHIDSVLSVQCKYAVLTGCLHRVHRGVMRRSNFVATIAAEITHMHDQGYEKRRLMATLRSFMSHAYRPPTHAAATHARIEAILQATERQRQTKVDAQRWVAQLMEHRRVAAATRRLQSIRAVLKALQVTQSVQARQRSRELTAKREAAKALRAVERRVARRDQVQAEAKAKRTLQLLNARGIVDRLNRRLIPPPPPPRPDVLAQALLASMRPAPPPPPGTLV
jgi:hypothetical protein